jgi:hypothetical protein
LAVIQQAYIEGVSMRWVDDLLKALGPTGMDSFSFRFPYQLLRVPEECLDVDGELAVVLE